MPYSSQQLYPDVNQGYTFIGTTAAAGVNLPAYNATAHVFCLWNPQGSPKQIVPFALTVGYVGTTGAAGNVVVSYQTGVGSQVASGSPITAATLATPVNAKLGSGLSSVAKFANSTITFASATSLLMTTGISQTVLTAATTSSPMWEAQWLFNGSVIVAPGSAICIAGNIALLGAYDITLIWEEVPTTIP